MPSSSKPRRKYRPRFEKSGQRRPGIDEAMVVFQPPFRLFDQLDTGYVDDAAGRPIMTEWDGGYCEIAPALLGWADCWQRIADAEQIRIDVEPLRRISRKLHAVTPLTEQEVSVGRAAMMETHRAFLRLPVGTIKRHANAEEMSIALGNIGIVGNDDARRAPL